MAERASAAKANGKKAAAATPPTPETKSRGGFSFWSVFFTFCGLLAFLALVSHQAGDIDIIAGGREGTIGNWIGRVGVYLARFFLYLFGIAAYPISLFVLLTAFWSFFPNTFHRRRGFPFAALAMILGLSMLLGLWPEYFVNATDRLGVGRSADPSKALSGGVIGQFLAAPADPLAPADGPKGVLRYYIGTVGSCVLAITLLITAAVFVWSYELRKLYALIAAHFHARWRVGSLSQEELVELEEYKLSKIEEARRRIEEKREQRREKDAASDAAKAAKSEQSRQAEQEKAVRDRAEEERRRADAARRQQEDAARRAQEEAIRRQQEDAARRRAAAAPPPETKPASTDARSAANADEAPDAPEATPDDETDAPEATPVPLSVERGSDLAVPQVKSSAPPVKAPKKPAFDPEGYILPPVKMLDEMKSATGDPPDVIEEAKTVLQDTLNSFGVDAEVCGSMSGPRVTRLEITLAPGVKVQKVTGLESNIKMNLQANSIRVLAPIPGKDAVGIEIPNRHASAVGLRNLLEDETWLNRKHELPFILGKNVAGEPIVTDLARAPHLLIAGATGSGKSVCVNTLIMSLIYRFKPSDLRMILVDPKVVEFEMYKTLPHLICPIVNDPKKVPLALRWGVNEMERRYRLLAKVKVKNLQGFNTRPLPREAVLDDDGEVIPNQLPFIVIIIDELADIMMVARQEVETSIARIAQKARAVGIHLVLATQRPSVKIITGVIKANLPTRIAFQVASFMDSRVILDHKGAETLLGRGDMLFLPPGTSKMERIQGAMVADHEIEKVVEFCAAQADQDFDETVTSLSDGEEEGDAERGGDVPAGPGKDFDDDEMDDEDDAEGDDSDEGKLIQRAIEIIRKDRKASTSYLQRRLGIGYNRAADLIDQLEDRGVIGPQIGSAPREILIGPES